MIRRSKKSDSDSILTIWLEASIKAHDFMPSSYWASKVDDVQEMYLPVTENYVFEIGEEIVAFISIFKNNLAALFVSPQHQGNGIGSQLIEYIKGIYNDLNLNVYKTNSASIFFYRKHGFDTVGEQIDEHTGQPELMMQLNP